jgi:hypothetical protein
MGVGDDISSEVSSKHGNVAIPGEHGVDCLSIHLDLNMPRCSSHEEPTVR